MPTREKGKLNRIGVFYDGVYFQKVREYYREYHDRRANLSIDGLHRFIVHHFAQAENRDERLCSVVEAHYFQGRETTDRMTRADWIAEEREFDDSLMRAQVTRHNFVVNERGKEVGVDIAFALEAYELAMFKKLTLVVLIAGDGDYVPLVRKLQGMGVKTMLLAWRFGYANTQGKEKTTNTSSLLIHAVTYPFMMHDVIGASRAHPDSFVDGLFIAIPTKQTPQNPTAGKSNTPTPINRNIVEPASVTSRLTSSTGSFTESGQTRPAPRLSAGPNSPVREKPVEKILKAGTYEGQIICIDGTKGELQRVEYGVDRKRTLHEKWEFDCHCDGWSECHWKFLHNLPDHGWTGYPEWHGTVRFELRVINNRLVLTKYRPCY